MGYRGSPKPCWSHLSAVVGHRALRITKMSVVTPSDDCSLPEIAIRLNPQPVSAQRSEVENDRYVAAALRQ